MRRLLLLCSFALATAAAHGADETRQLAPFRAIAISGPVNMEVHAGQAQSVKISGRPEFIGKIVMSVKGEELKIEYSGTKNMTMKDGDKIVVTVPSLVKCVVEGAGQIVIDNIKEERVDLQFQGAGRMEAKGNVKWLRVKAQGVGEVDTKALKAERADVNFEGIGSVSVHASGTLNAVVRGMGNLTYYGHPKVLNKSATGIGEIQSGD